MKLNLAMAVALVLCFGTPALADHDYRRGQRHDYGYAHHHHPREYRVDHSRRRVRVSYSEVHRYRSHVPIHYHYRVRERRYVEHYDRCDHGYLLLGGAMVLSELIHHAYDRY